MTDTKTLLEAVPAISGVTREELARARRQVANHVAATTGTAADLALLLTALGIRDEKLIYEVTTTATQGTAKTPARLPSRATRRRSTSRLRKAS